MRKMLDNQYNSAKCEEQIAMTRKSGIKKLYDKTIK